ncbi:MAG: OmpA family protein [Pseudomonadota bacterium]
MTVFFRRPWGAALVLIASVVVASASGAQALRDSLFAETDAAYQAAREANAGMFAPRNYERGQKAYASAEEALERGRNVETVRARLADAKARFDEALESVDLARPVLANAMRTRANAETADASALSGPIWEDAEKKLANAIRELEKGDIKDGKRFALEAESLYRDAELGAIKTRYLSDTRKLLADAERARVSRYAPETLSKSRSLLARAEKELNENRYDTDLPRNLAQQANYEARHAIYLAEVVRKVRDKDMSVEDLVLQWEAPLIEISGAADVVPDLATGGDALGTQLANVITQLRDNNQSLGQDLADSEARANEMADEIRLLDEKLGGATAERTALMQRLQRQARIKEQFETVERMFAREQAVVFREGDNITLRLVGLSFASGKSTIESNYFTLLEQVEAAIDVFPRSNITVEGHTDSYGSDASNETLSQSRADAVVQYMLNAMRIPSSRLTATGFGESRPIANNETAEGRARNRRIDVVINPQLQ